jgi:hypothetical protein
VLDAKNMLYRNFILTDLDKAGFETGELAKKNDVIVIPLRTLKQIESEVCSFGLK